MPPSTSHLKGVKIQRARHVDPKIHDHILGIPVGTRWDKRTECSRDGVHAPLRAGIHGTASSGAYSIVMSGGYEDDLDYGETFEYTGQGGRDMDGDKLGKMRGKNLWEAPQSGDQAWNHGNKALKVSATTGKPVRVVRGANLNSKYRPAEGYRYDGLYTVVKAWQEKGKGGFVMCKFKFERVKGQPPLPLYGDPEVGTSRAPIRNLSPEVEIVENRKRKQSQQGNGTRIKKTKSGKKTATIEGITFKYEGT